MWTWPKPALPLPALRGASTSQECTYEGQVAQSRQKHHDVAWKATALNESLFHCCLGAAAIKVFCSSYCTVLYSLPGYCRKIKSLSLADSQGIFYPVAVQSCSVTIPMSLVAFMFGTPAAVHAIPKLFHGACGRRIASRRCTYYA